ncbi:ROK family protein [Enterobacter sp. RHBSTW-00994]|uniref:ROK family protein n=1 Tax=Enterobacter sp. RHBSTW-00994 TaxID=2742676 RepID=UPI0015E96BBA|nr:ROK family protein [Enterobacter sp. RHBSTW-00994]QLR41225.1 ROK family protein [Enterobacter sp. RHBSTW-00994]
MFHLGLDIGGTKMEAVLLDDAGTVVLRERRPTCKAHYQGFLDNLMEMITGIRTATQYDFTVGIGLPGAIDPQSGLIKNCNCLVLNGENLKRDLTVLLNQPVFLANDADCFTLSEAVDGAGKGYGTVFGVIVGTGCGGGVVVKGQLLSGPNAIAGEWGHNPLPGWHTEQDGSVERCYCQHENCIESFISGTGFSRRFNARHGTQYTPEMIIAAANEGDPRAVTHYHHFIDAFARSLAGVINTIDPHVIVLGGGLSNVESLYRDLPPVVEKYIFSPTCRTQIAKAQFGDASGVRGAAWLPVRVTGD